MPQRDRKPEKPPSTGDTLDRRRVLQGVGAAALASLPLSALAGCGEDSSPPGRDPRASSSSGGTSGGTASSSGTTSGGPSASSSGAPADGGAGTCTLYPEQTDGPFYFDPQLVRKDITEGAAGVPLTLRLTVLAADGCTPIEGAVVDVWQNDARGVYSGYPGQVGGLDTTGQTFLRGLQRTDASGVAEVKTIYPGWYPGRTTHVHLKVHLANETAITSQMYFPEDVTSVVYATSAYAPRGQKDTSNAADGIAGTEPVTVLAVSGNATAGYVGSLTITVKPG